MFMDRAMGYVYKGAMVSTALRVPGRFGWLHILRHSLSSAIILIQRDYSV